ncbi:hypothetical protein QBC34DRAFT_499598 [Podospora aff. communis PSN243]|uniref:Mitochondrial adapter protein MCP1 transmembrane domain-containing protein n=1 Tax=Podospora aff. communis PSN243 TaxID=3040156 RepID=A0AAV9G635_9PEZI|nr:hypothetical protein QBC34DRAFT_499598 [Podospora aff. communis PSN243]
MDSESLRTKGSQDTLASLIQLDPSPIESPRLNTEKDLPPLPEHEDDLEPSIKPRRQSATGVGLSGSHGAIYYLTRIQRYSSYTFSLFAGLHLATTSIIPLVARSVPSSESYLLLAREIYQTPPSEPLLVGLPVLAHVGSGLALRFIRRNQNVRRYWGASGADLRVGWPHFSYIAASGYGFAAALAAHVFVNRALPLAVEGDSANIGLAYVAHGFVRHRLTSWAAYAALLGLGCGHMIWGWAKWFGLAQGAGWKLERHTGNATVDRQTKKKRRRRLLVINAVAAVVTAVWAAGGLGVVARGGETPGWVGRLYDGLYARIPGF